MKLIKKIDVMNDKKTIIILNLIAIPLMFAFAFLLTIIVLVTSNISNIDTKKTILESILLLFVLFGLIIFHELIHGFFFKVFNLKGKVKFGFKNGLAYATSPGSYYNKIKFSCIILAPFILISLMLTMLYNFKIIQPFDYILITSIHGAACVGDFYWILLILTSPKNSIIEDTEQGINFYLNEN